MKKTLLSLLLLLGLEQVAQAQAYLLVVPVRRTVLHYGAFGSFQTSHYTATSSPDYTFADDGGASGGGGGVFMDMFFNRHIAFTVGLNTASRGGRFAAVYQGRTPISSAIPSVQASYDLKTRYTYLPIGLKLFTGEVLPRTSFYVQGLLSAGFLSGATNYGSETKTVVKQYSSSTSTYNYKYSKQLDFTDFEASLGLGAEIRLAEKLDAFASVRYCKGLNSAQNTPLDFVLTNDFYAKSEAYPLHNSAVSVEFGLIFVPFRGGKQPSTPSSEPSPIRTTYQLPTPAPLAAR
jgi:hypothetical protein